MKEKIKAIGSFALVMAIVLGGIEGCNMGFNNRTINRPAYRTESRASGLTGHVEYTKYLDGSQDVKINRGFWSTLFGSELHQDLDGDGFVDRIRLNSSELKMYRLYDILVRGHDYPANKARFDAADKQLQELAAKYPAKK